MVFMQNFIDCLLPMKKSARGNFQNLGCWQQHFMVVQCSAEINS